MINSILGLDQVVIALFSMLIVYQSFKGLNHCTKTTALVIRLSLILFLTGSVGVLLLIAGGIQLPWPYSLLIIGTACQLMINRRKYSQHSLSKIHNKHS